jgi:hypothetical protein
LLPPEAEEPSRSADPRASEDAPLAGAPAVLAGSSSDRFQGQVASDREVFVSQTANGRWKLVVAGQAAPQRSAFGWAMAFGATSGGAGVLAYHTPLTRTLAIVLEMLVWAATAVALMVGWRLRRHRGGDEPAVSVSLQPVERPEKLVVGPALEALDSAVRAPAGSRRRPSRVTEAPGDSEELWQ